MVPLVMVPRLVIVFVKTTEVKVDCCKVLFEIVPKLTVVPVKVESVNVPDVMVPILVTLDNVASLYVPPTMVE